MIECKIQDVPASEIMAAYNTFIKNEGQVEEPFKVKADWSRNPEHAWPFQFHASVIVECSGFTEMDTEEK